MQERLIDRNPLPPGIGARLASQLAFVAEVDRLKSVLRASLLAAEERRENDAEHSWHLALMVIVLAEYAEEPIDVGRTIQLVVIHDLIEIYAGDSPVYDPAAVRTQAVREAAAADRLFTQLPEDQAAQLRAMWEEYEAGTTPEARFGRALDRVEPMLLNWLNEGGTWGMPGANLGTVRARAAGIEPGSSRLHAAVSALIAESTARGWIRPE
ncbi:MAG: HD domain-containing protein [Nocardioides sp.]|uniref:HD domain-containing protein n=1 Tax=Nocardioides sp. TaxID=35761 RepID=UPI0039E4C398